MFSGYVCKADEHRLYKENIISISMIYKGETDPISDAPMTCIYCGKKTSDIFVRLVDF